MKYKLNDILLYIFLLTLACGSSLFLFPVGEFHLFAFRIVVILLPVILLFNKAFYQRDKGMTDFFLIVIFIWLCYGVVSLSWVLSIPYAIKDLTYIVTGLLMAISLFALSQNDPEFLKKFVRIWSVGFIVNIIIAVWEVATGGHFKSEFSDKLYALTPEHYENFSPASVFGNPNHFAIYLFISISLFIVLRKNLHTGVLCFFLTIATVLCYLTYSRLAMMSILFPYACLIYEERKYIAEKLLTRQTVIFLATLLIIIPGIYFTNQTDNPREKILAEKFEFLDKELLSRQAHRRENLVRNGIDFIKSSGGLGIGAGQYRYYIENEQGSFDTYEITNPHSGAIEILSEYGIPVALLLVIFWILLGIKIYKQKIEQTLLVFLIFSIGLVLLSNANSVFIMSPLNWMMMILPVLFYVSGKKNIQSK